MVANEDQATFWTETAGPVWLAREEDLDVSSRAFGLATMDAANVRAGETVLDVGCGTGSTTIELGRRVGTTGKVLGLDISPLLLGRAREKAGAAGAANVDFIDADAQTHQLRDSYDLVFSRFGVMFFEGPVAAFANLRAAAAPGGRLAFVTWQDLFSNTWMSMPVMAASSVLGGFDPPPEGAPGPFFYADADRARSVLAEAGYQRIDIEPFQTTMDIAVADVSDWLGFIVSMGPLGGTFQQSDADTQRRTLDAVLASAASYETDGVYRLPAAAWIATARA
jgi:SAM-dependent methyltransferase